MLKQSKMQKIRLVALILLISQPLVHSQAGIHAEIHPLPGRSKY